MKLICKQFIASIIFIICASQILLAQTIYSHYFRKPFDGNQRVTQNYENFWTGHGYHDGIDYGMPVGTPILATADGRVVKAESAGGWGWMVRIEHRSKIYGLIYSQYAHLNRRPLVKVGDFVSAGQQIGECGTTGSSTGYHLHFSIIKSNINGSGYYPTLSSLRANHYNPNIIIFDHKDVRPGSKFYFDNDYPNYAKSGAWNNVSTPYWNGGTLSSYVSIGRGYTESTNIHGDNGWIAYNIPIYKSGDYRVSIRVNSGSDRSTFVRYRVEGHSDRYRSQRTSSHQYSELLLGNFSLSQGKCWIKIWNNSYGRTTHDAIALEYLGPNSSSGGSTSTTLYHDTFTNGYKSFWSFYRGNWYASSGKLCQRDGYSSAKAYTPRVRLNGFNMFEVQVSGQINRSRSGRGRMYIYFPGGYVRLDDRSNQIKVRTNQSYYYNFNVQTHQIYNIKVRGTSSRVFVWINGSYLQIPTNRWYDDEVELRTKYSECSFDDFHVKLFRSISKQDTTDSLVAMTPVRMSSADDERLDTLTENHRDIVSLSPNPFSEQVTFSLYPPQDGVIKLSIFNLQGQTLYHAEDDIKANQLQQYIWSATSQQHIPSGTYMYIITINGKPIKSGKLIFRP